MAAGNEAILAEPIRFSEPIKSDVFTDRSSAYVDNNNASFEAEQNLDDDKR